MKLCDRALSPFSIASSSSLPFVASESDPEDSFWSDFTFDFSFLTCEDHKNSINNDHVDATIVCKDLKCVDSQTSTSLAVISDFDSNVTIGEGRSKLFVPTASAKSIALANDKDDIELDSPCWRGKNAESSIKSLNFRRCSDDVNGVHGLNPLAPQFIPSNVKKKLDRNGRDTCEQGTRIVGVLIHGADESLGLVSQDSVGKKTMNMLDISNELQKSKKLDPLAPVFVPEKHVAADQMIAIQKNELGTTYSFNPQLGSQVEIFENTKLDRFSDKSHGKKKLNPLAPQFSIESHRAVSLSSSSDVKALSPKMDVKKLLTTIHGLSELLVHGSATLESPNEQDLDLINCTVQNLSSYVNNTVQEHTGNYSSAIQSSCDMNSLPNMHKRSIRDLQAKNTSDMVDVKRKEKYSMVSEDMLPDSNFEFGVTRENGFGKVLRNHQTEEQINPQVLFYKSLWLKSKADRSLMVYETFLSKTRT